MLSLGGGTHWQAARLKALLRKTAICPRVTKASGQKTGGENGGFEAHPAVIPSAAMRSMKLTYSPKARTRKAAICARVTFRSGQ